MVPLPKYKKSPLIRLLWLALHCCALFELLIEGLAELLNAPRDNQFPPDLRLESLGTYQTKYQEIFHFVLPFRVSSGILPILCTILILS